MNNFGGGKSLFKHETTKGENGQMPKMCVLTVEKRAIGVGSRREVRNKDILVQSYSVFQWQGELPIRSRDLVRGKELTIPFCVCERKYICGRKHQRDRFQILKWFSPGGGIRGDFNFLSYVSMFCCNIIIMCMLWLS